MKVENYFYNCSKEYLHSISPDLYKEIVEVISKLPIRKTQSEINNDLFWLFTHKGWSYGTFPVGLTNSSPEELKIGSISKLQIKKQRNHLLCVTSTTLETRWHTDFAKLFNGKLAQLEVQFGKVEAMFKDFCGFKIALFERRLEIGIEIVLSDPRSYFFHRKRSISGMTYFSIAQKTLSTIGLKCPVWLIGIKE